MDIYTSYFANIKNLPKNIIPISICSKAPDYYNGIQYKILAPKYWWFIKWKHKEFITEYDLKEHNLQHLSKLCNKILDNNDYEILYKETVLNNLNIDIVINDLYTLSNGKNIALICYENSFSFCHRQIVLKWIKENGYKIKEWGMN